MIQGINACVISKAIKKIIKATKENAKAVVLKFGIDRGLDFTESTIRKNIDSIGRGGIKDMIAIGGVQKIQYRGGVQNLDSGYHRYHDLDL